MGQEIDTIIVIAEWREGRSMETPNKTWKDNLLESFAKLEELEARKKSERAKMVEFISSEQYDFYLQSESELKKMDTEIEDLSTGIRVNRERWKIAKATQRERKPD